MFSAGPLVPLPPTTRRKPKAASLTYLEGGLEHEKRVVDTGDAIDDRDDDDEEHDDDQGEFQENGHGGGGRYAAPGRTGSGRKKLQKYGDQYRFLTDTRLHEGRAHNLVLPLDFHGLSDQEEAKFLKRKTFAWLYF